jgi:hypothetical protein
MLIAAPGSVLAQDRSLEAAGDAARGYLMAYFARDAAGVVALIHPETLAEGKRMIVAQYELARDSGSLSSFQRTLGLEGDPAQVVALEPGALYARLITAGYQDMSEAELAALDDIEVEATDVRLLEPDIARVTLSILGPTPTGYREEIEVIDLALHEGLWLVLGDSPEP